jgi:hypothetical protein
VDFLDVVRLYTSLILDLTVFYSHQIFKIPSIAQVNFIAASGPVGQDMTHKAISGKEQVLPLSSMESCPCTHNASQYSKLCFV